MQANQYRIFAALLLVTCLALIPIWGVSHPPLKDYPNHLARMYILMMDGASAGLNRYYEIDWSLLPNLAMDLVVPALGRFVGIEAAGKVFLSATLISMLTGTVALHYAAHGRWSAWPLLVALLLYSQFFLWGFVNFLFALGVSFWLVALWILFRERHLSWLFFSLAALGLFFLHLMAFGIYLVIICAFEVGALFRENFNYRWAIKRGLQVMSQALPALTLLFVASPTGGGQSGALFSHLSLKVGWFRYLFSNYDPFIDFKLTFLPLSVCFFVGIITRVFRFNRLMIFPLAAILLAYLALPQALMTSGAVWRRFLLPLAMLAVASTDWHIGREKLRFALATLVGFLFLGRLWVVYENWVELDRDLSSIRGLMRMIPRGATLYPLEIAEKTSSSLITHRTHFPAMSIIDRDAFVPILFAHHTQQPVRFSDAAKSIMRDDAKSKVVESTGSARDWKAISHYNYVLIMNVNKLIKDPPETFRRVAIVDDVALYRIER
jgi:hypothetical protein